MGLCLGSSDQTALLFRGGTGEGKGRTEGFLFSVNATYGSTVHSTNQPISAVYEVKKKGAVYRAAMFYTLSGSE